jgi:hypothetical protein
LKTPIHIIPSRASQSAIKAVEAVGGSVFCQYYNPMALRDCVKSREDRISAAPTRRTDIRGFLSPLTLTISESYVFKCGTPIGATEDIFLLKLL